MDNKLTVMAVGAHPDDIEILCGGTLALYKRGGHTVCMYYATDGSKGGLGKTDETIRAERLEEAKNSAKVIGADIFGGDFIDGEIEVSLESRLKMIDAIRSCGPDIIITHHPDDYHTDHANVSKLVFESVYHVAIPNTITKHEAIENIPVIFYMDTVTGLGFEPEYFVDITPVIDLKKKMMEAHKSQIEFVKKHHGVDFIDLIEITGRYRGFQCNTRYAEGFLANKGWLRVPASRLLP